MNAAPTLRTTIDVPLQVPIPIKTGDGAERQVAKLTLHRPKARHAKRLAVIVGPELVKGFLENDEVKAEEIASRVIEALMGEDKLDALFDLVADLAREDVSIIEEVDTIDLMEVGKAFLGFFPALQSAMLTSAASLLQQPGIGNHPN
jgi:hypothetical protein